MRNLDFIVEYFLVQLLGRIAVVGHVAEQNLVVQHAQRPDLLRNTIRLF